MPTNNFIKNQLKSLEHDQKADRRQLARYEELAAELISQIEEREELLFMLRSKIEVTSQ